MSGQGEQTDQGRLPTLLLTYSSLCALKNMIPVLSVPLQTHLEGRTLPVHKWDASHQHHAGFPPWEVKDTVPPDYNIRCQHPLLGTRTKPTQPPRPVLPPLPNTPSPTPSPAPAPLAPAKKEEWKYFAINWVSWRREQTRTGWQDQKQTGGTAGPAKLRSSQGRHPHQAKYPSRAEFPAPGKGLGSSQKPLHPVLLLTDSLHRNT